MRLRMCGDIVEQMLRICAAKMVLQTLRKAFVQDASLRSLECPISVIKGL